MPSITSLRVSLFGKPRRRSRRKKQRASRSFRRACRIPGATDTHHESSSCCCCAGPSARQYNPNVFSSVECFLHSASNEPEWPVSTQRRARSPPTSTKVPQLLLILQPYMQLEEQELQKKRLNRIKGVVCAGSQSERERRPTTTSTRRVSCVFVRIACGGNIRSQPQQCVSFFSLVNRPCSETTCPKLDSITMNKCETRG